VACRIVLDVATGERDESGQPWGGALIAALATEGHWPEGAFSATGLTAEPDEARTKLWDELWAGMNPPASGPDAGVAS
jgi:hypothetical protein